MIVYNSVSCVLYICMLHDCYRRPEVYVGISFLEILAYMILCIFSFGWDAGFQNWTFAVITASFLPAYKTPDVVKTRKMSFAYSALVVIVFLLFYIFRGTITLPNYTPLSDTLTKVVFIVNVTLTFASIILFALFFSFKTQRREFELTRKADYDELTNLYNRYAITKLHLQILNESLANNLNYSIAILDIDHFKNVNDTYGHNSGDIVLKEISKMLKMLSSKDIIPGRWGGEEFILIAPSSIGYKTFVSTLEKLNQKIAKYRFRIENGKDINLTVSIGAAFVSPDLSVEEAVGEADQKLYEAKNTGRNKVLY